MARTKKIMVNVRIVVDDPKDADEKDSTGLTNAAYERLIDALSSAGFSYDDVEKD